MATQERRKDALIDRVLNHPDQFEFFQVVRLLELATKYAANDGEPTAHRNQLPADPIRFCSSESLAFSAAPVVSVNWNERQQHFRLRSTPLSLIGANGVLPDYFTQKLIGDNRNNNKAFQSLLDLFHQRIQQLLFRSLGKHQLDYAFETHARSGGQKTDVFGRCLQRLVGLPESITSWRDLELDNLVYYASLFLHASRPAAGLQTLIESYFSTRATVRQFQGRWLHLATRDQSRVSSHPEKSRFAKLGLNFTLGTRLWDLRSSCRIILGPLSRKQFERLLPGQQGYLQLAELTQLYAGKELEFQLQPEIQPADVSPWRLSDQGQAGRLGWNTWCGTAATPDENRPHPLISLN